jgi:hypothetical protein
MGRRKIIWQNKLEDYVKNLHFEQRKNFKEIAEIIKKEKTINISPEAVRVFISKENLHDNTQGNTIKHA